MFRAFVLQIFVLFTLWNYSLLQPANPSTQPWDYQRHGPDTWPHTFDTCEGEFQSPIDIRLSRVKYDPHLNPLSIDTYTTNTSLYVWNITHNGRTIMAYPQPLAPLSISGANLPEVFYLVEFHFHWGYNAYQGSEHTIDGSKYPLEMQFVHQGRFSRAFAVLSILFELRSEDNSYINDLLSILNQTIDTSISITHQLDISRLFPRVPSPRFYLYNGSITTPPCTEGITWIILERKIPISPYQLEVFSRNSIPVNFRHPQLLHARTVLANFQPQMHDEDDAGGHHHSSSFVRQAPVVLLLLTLSLLFVHRESKQFI